MVKQMGFILWLQDVKDMTYGEYWQLSPQQKRKIELEFYAQHTEYVPAHLEPVLTEKSQD